jgi:hypothetical protein
VTLSSNSPSLTVPASLLIAAGQTSGTFSISTSPVAAGVTATITAHSSNNVTANVAIAMPCVQSLNLSIAAVLGGNGLTATVTLHGAAPVGGVAVAITLPAGVTGPASVTVAAGATSASFSVSTSPVASNLTGSIQVSVGLCGVISASLTVNAPVPISLTVSPSQINLLGTATATVTLNGAAPAGGLTLTVQSSILGTQLQVPATVTVPAGSTTGTFNCKSLITALSGLLSPVTGTVSVTIGGVTQSAGITLKIL